MKISIITMVYNRVNSIEDTIRSVLGEKELYSDVEYIIVDGKSKDGTMDIINKYREQIDVIISEPDDGIHDAMNKGIRKATGDFVFFIAGDDVFIKGALLRFVNDVKSDTEVWSGSIIMKYCGGYKYRYSSSDLSLLYEGVSLQHPATFFRKSAFEKYGYYNKEYKIAGDRELFLRFYTSGAKFQVSNLPITLFSMDGVSAFDFGDENLKLTIHYGMDKDIATKKAVKSYRFRTSNVRKIIEIIIERLHIYKIVYTLLGKGNVVVNKKDIEKYGLERI